MDLCDIIHMGFLQTRYQLSTSPVPKLYLHQVNMNKTAINSHMQSKGSATGSWTSNAMS